MINYTAQQILWHEDHDRHVGHFTSFETATKFVLPSSEIQLSPLARTNDPRENKEKLFGAVFAKPEENQFAKSAVELLTTAVRHHVKAFCTTRNYVDERGALNECFRRPRMWAQYGDKHRGVCLIFDRDILAKEIQRAFASGYCDNIYYFPRSGRGDRFRHLEPASFEQTKEAFVVNHLQEHATRLFFEKDGDWKDECEFRYLVFDFDSDEPVQVNFGDALRAIVLGVDFPKAEEPAIRQVAGQIPVVNLQWSDSNNCFWPDLIDHSFFQKNG